MGAMYVFFLSFGGIVILLSLKTWEISRGAKPFSVFRYRMDIVARKVFEKLRYWSGYVNTRNARLFLAFLFVKIDQVFNSLLEKSKQSRIFLFVKGKILPPEGTGTVSAFLKDVAEFKKEASNSSAGGAEEIRVE